MTGLDLGPLPEAPGLRVWCRRVMRRAPHDHGRVTFLVRPRSMLVRYKCRACRYSTCRRGRRDRTLARSAAGRFTGGGNESDPARLNRPAVQTAARSKTKSAVLSHPTPRAVAFTLTAPSSLTTFQFSSNRVSAD